MRRLIRRCAHGSCTHPNGLFVVPIVFLPLACAFLFLAALSLTASVAVFTIVPRLPTSQAGQRSRYALQGFVSAVTDRRFLRVAPLSASVVGTSFAVHGLWAAQWFRDVDRFAPDDVLDGLLGMGAGLTLGSLAIGAAAVGLENLRVSCTKAFGWFCAGFMALQVAVPGTVMRWKRSERCLRYTRRSGGLAPTMDRSGSLAMSGVVL